MDQIKMKDLQTEAEKKPFATAVKALWIEMFEDKESYVDHYMSSSWKHNRVLLLLRGEEIVSMLHLNPYTCIVQGERLDLHYIVGVCTKKAEQGKGYMGQLVTEALRICKEDGEPFTYLMPAAEAIYRPYDFVSAGWCDKFVIEAEEVEEADPSLPQARWDAIVPELGQAGSIQNVGNHTLQICPFDRWTAGQTKQLESFAAELPMDMHAAWTAAYFAETDQQMKCYDGELVAVWDQEKPIAIAAYLCEEDQSEAEITHVLAAKQYQKLVCRQLAEYVRKRLNRQDIRLVCNLPAYSFDAERMYCTTMIRPLQEEWFAKRISSADGDCMNIQNLVKLWLQGVMIYTPELV